MKVKNNHRREQPFRQSDFEIIITIITTIIIIISLNNISIILRDQPNISLEMKWDLFTDHCPQRVILIG